MKEEEPRRWYAIKTMRPFRLAEEIGEREIATYLPVTVERREDGSMRRKPMIPKLLFMHADHTTAKSLEAEARKETSSMPSFWIYRYKKGGEIQAISDREFRLFRLLTAEDDTRCEVYRKEEFKIGDRLRVTGGPFAGYEGYARRIRKNKHIVVEIEGLCAIALPFIHPDLLEKIEI